VISNMVDIFEIAPAREAGMVSHAPCAIPGQDMRAARYQNLLSRLAAGHEEALSDVKVWPATVDDDTIEMQHAVPPVKTEVGGPLLGNFADLREP
jgi:hypothetical protein